MVFRDDWFAFQCWRRSTFAALIWATSCSARQDAGVLSLLRKMEMKDELTLFDRSDAQRHAWRAAKTLSNELIEGPSISTDGLAVCWAEIDLPGEGRKRPFLNIDSVRTGIRAIQLPYRSALYPAMSDRPLKIVVTAMDFEAPHKRSLLLLDLQNGLNIVDMTQFVTTFDIRDQDSISISSSGALVAIGSRIRFQVIELTNGRTVISDSGRFPRLSPDGKRLAFVRHEELRMCSLADRRVASMLSEYRVMGIGSWSPDGRFLLASAWTRLFSFNKKQIVIDTFSGRYAELTDLGEGDYGTQSAWISKKLLIH